MNKEIFKFEIFMCLQLTSLMGIYNSHLEFLGPYCTIDLNFLGFCKVSHVLWDKVFLIFLHVIKFFEHLYLFLSIKVFAYYPNMGQSRSLLPLRQRLDPLRVSCHWSIFLSLLDHFYFLLHLLQKIEIRKPPSFLMMSWGKYRGNHSWICSLLLSKLSWVDP